MWIDGPVIYDKDAQHIRHHDRYFQGLVTCYDEEVDDCCGIFVGCHEFSSLSLVKDYHNVNDICILPLIVLIALVTASSEETVQAQAKTVLPPLLLAIFFMLCCALMKCS